MVNLHIPGGPDVLRLADVRMHVHDHTGIVPEHQVLVSNGRLLLGNGSEVVAEQGDAIEVEVQHRPADEDTISVRTHFEGGYIESSYRADAPVSDLQRFLARTFQVAPCRQVLTTLGVAMEEEDQLGAYAVEDPIVVDMAVTDPDTEWPEQLVYATVYYRDGTAFTSFVVDARDTFDVLLGILEMVNMVQPGEEVTFFSGTTIYQSWRTFAYYELRFPVLMMLEDRWP